MSAFMIPEYTTEAFHTADGCDPVPAAAMSLMSYLEYMEDSHATDYGLHPAGKWWYRLSAPGYMDATDWHGPFDTEAEARADCEATYEVDPDTGEELTDE